MGTGQAGLSHGGRRRHRRRRGRLVRPAADTTGKVPVVGEAGAGTRVTGARAADDDGRVKRPMTGARRVTCRTQQIYRQLVYTHHAQYKNKTDRTRTATASQLVSALI